MTEDCILWRGFSTNGILCASGHGCCLNRRRRPVACASPCSCGSSGWSHSSPRSPRSRSPWRSRSPVRICPNAGSGIRHSDLRSVRYSRHRDGGHRNAGHRSEGRHREGGGHREEGGRTRRLRSKPRHCRRQRRSQERGWIYATRQAPFQIFAKSLGSICTL